MCLGSLPRDVWLAVVGKLDMDTRIKCGIIFKLGVPEGVRSRIADAVCNRPEHLQHLDRLSLGPRLVWNNNDNVRMPRYVIQLFKGAFQVMNLGNDMRVQTYALNVDANNWSHQIVL